jgi:hypothetical protein
MTKCLWAFLRTSSIVASAKADEAAFARWIVKTALDARRVAVRDLEDLAARGGLPQYPGTHRGLAS